MGKGEYPLIAAGLSAPTLGRIAAGPSAPTLGGGGPCFSPPGRMGVGEVGARTGGGGPSALPAHALLEFVDGDDGPLAPGFLRRVGEQVAVEGDPDRGE